MDSQTDKKGSARLWSLKIIVISKFREYYLIKIRWYKFLNRVPLYPTKYVLEEYTIDTKDKVHYYFQCSKEENI
jgi:hypothetical protein